MTDKRITFAISEEAHLNLKTAATRWGINQFETLTIILEALDLNDPRYVRQIETARAHARRERELRRKIAKMDPEELERLTRAIK